MQVLLTGATGLIGPYVLNRLLERGEEVRVLALPDTVDRMPDHDRIEVVVGDLSDVDVLMEAADGVDVVYHLAARVLGASARDLVDVNVTGTENLLDASAAGRIGRFVFISSVAVYAPAPTPDMWPITEESPLQAHGNESLYQYGQSKIDGEALVQEYQREHNFEYTIIRPPAVYGKEAPWVGSFIQRLMRRPGQAMAPAAQDFRMHWVHVDDLAEGILLAGTRPEAANRVFNIAGPEVFTQATLVALLWKDWMGTEGRRAERFFEARFNGTDVLKYDITKAHRLLEYVPTVELELGLREVVAAMGSAARTTRWPSRRFAQAWKGEW